MRSNPATRQRHSGEIVVGARNHPHGKEDIYFGEHEKFCLLASAPSSKLNPTLDYGYDPFSVNVRVVRFAEVVLLNWDDVEDVYGAAFTVDVTLGWDITESFALRVGVANLLNAYPSQQDPALTETGGDLGRGAHGFRRRVLLRPARNQDVRSRFNADAGAPTRGTGPDPIRWTPDLLYENGTCILDVFARGEVRERVHTEKGTFSFEKGRITLRHEAVGGLGTDDFFRITTLTKERDGSAVDSVSGLRFRHEGEPDRL